MTKKSITARVVLRGMTWDHPRGVDGLRATDPLLIEHHRVTIDWAARSRLAFGDQHVADFAADIDLMIIDHPHVPDAVEAGALLPLDGSAGLDALERESVGRSHDRYHYRGSQWALGIDAAAQVSAFRPDQTDSAPSKPVDAFSTFATLLAQHGAPSAQPGRVLTLAVAGEVLELMFELADAVPKWCADANPIDVAEALVADNDYSVGVALFGYTTYSRTGFRPHELACDDISSFDGRAGGSTLGGAGIAVRRPLDIRSWRSPQRPCSQRPCSPGARCRSAPIGPNSARGGQPGNPRVWRSDRANEMTHGFFRNTLRTLERAWVRAPVVGWPDLQLALSHLVRDAILARRVDETTLDHLESLAAAHLTEEVA